MPHISSPTGRSEAVGSYMRLPEAVFRLQFTDFDSLYQPLRDAALLTSPALLAVEKQWFLICQVLASSTGLPTGQRHCFKKNVITIQVASSPTLLAFVFKSGLKLPAL